MTTRTVHRPARTVAPLTPEAPLTVSSPPLLPDGKSGTGLQSMIPLVGSAGALSMMMFLRGSGFAALGAIIMVVSLVAASVMFVTQRGQASRKRRSQRELYLDHLEDLREQFRESEDALRAAAVRRDPPTGHLLDVIADPARLWERRRIDVDFLRIRLGTGTLPVRELHMRDEGTVVNPTDPHLRAEAEAVIRRFSQVQGLPLRIGLDRAGDVSLIGTGRDDVLAVARTLLSQVAAWHAPDDVTIAVLTPVEREADWAWVRWLPHLLDRTDVGPDGPVPLFATDLDSLTALLAEDMARRATAAATSFRHGAGTADARTRPRLLIIDDAFGQVARPVLPDQATAMSTALPALGVTVVHLLADRLHEPGEISGRITVRGGELLVEDLRAAPPMALTGGVDSAPAPVVEGLARRLAPLRLSPDSYDDGSGTPPADFAALLDLPDPSDPDLERRWRPRHERDFLRVPLGVDPAGRPLLLDLKEAAALGMGPHGLCVGATGSGKSELLRTLVLGLASTHPPDLLGLVLVDYKGGATFAPFAGLPHLAGLITNLSGDAALVRRMYTSLEGEVLRRQQVLADARVTDITEYAMRSAEDPDLPPLRHLMVIIDEFGELLTAEPEFVELFLRIGRIGRSIGVHLLLSSQRIEAGKLRGLDTYLSYRIGLRTLSETESRTVLDTPDAFALPALPGHGYLKVDVSVYQAFKTAYVSGPLDRADVEPSPTTGPRARPMPRFGVARPAAATGDPAAATRRTTGPTLLSTLVGHIARAAQAVEPIWLPPLPPSVSLDRAAGGMAVTPDGVRLCGPPDQAGLPVPLGLLDDPARQWQGTWTVDLARGGGHLVIIGGPGTGKSTALRTLALGIATTRSPVELAVYGADLAGAGLRPLAGLPHVGGVAGRDERERVRRTVDEVHAMLGEREVLFARHGLDSAAELRAAGGAPGLACTEVVLLIDGYGQLGGEFETLEAAVHDLLARGGRYGIHVVATARRWNEVRSAQQVAFAQRVELRLTEPAESGVDAKLARGLPREIPGRALTTDRRYAQVALPRLDGLAFDDARGLGAAVTLVRGSWTGPLPPPVRVLPALLPAAELYDALPGVLAAAPVRPEITGRPRIEITARRVPTEQLRLVGAEPAGAPPVMGPSATRPPLVDGSLVPGSLVPGPLVPGPLVAAPEPIPFGRFERDLARAEVDLFGRDQHLLALGDSATGKTNLLRLLVDGLVRRFTADELVFAVFDPRRGLAGVVPEPYLGGYAPNATLAARLAGSVCAELVRRDPADGPAAAPRIVLLVDDYDVLAASAAQPLGAFVPHLAGGSDIGLHVLMTRRVMGASRGIYEPFTLAVRESGCLGLLLSGDRTEGQLLAGVRPMTLPVGRAQLVRPGEPVRTVQTAYLAAS